MREAWGTEIVVPSTQVNDAFEPCGYPTPNGFAGLDQLPLSTAGGVEQETTEAHLASVPVPANLPLAQTTIAFAGVSLAPEEQASVTTEPELYVESEGDQVPPAI